MASQTSNLEIQETMNETEIGAFLYKYKTAALALVLAAFVAVAGFALYNYYDGQQKAKVTKALYEFRQGPLKDYQDKKIDALKLYEDFNALEGKYQGQLNLALPLMEISDILVEQGQLEKAQELLQKGVEKYAPKGPLVHYFIGLRYAAVAEDLGQDQVALTSLEKLLGLPFKLLESKLYLDLGRLYLKTQNSDKARASFQHVVDNPGQAEMVKLARLYLADMDKGQAQAAKAP